MSGTFPTSPGFRNVRTKLKHYQLVSESVSGRIQVRSLNSSRREFTVEFPPMTKAEFEPIYEFVAAQQGMLETFSIAIPDPTTPGSNELVDVRLMGEIQEFNLGVDNVYTFEVDLVEVI